jgi:hypothetical protein
MPEVCRSKAASGGLGKRSPFYHGATNVHRWWSKRAESDRSWKVPAAAHLLANGCNLDRKNPSAKADIAHLPPEQLAAIRLGRILKTKRWKP